MTPTELKARQSCQHMGLEWLRARARTAGNASGRSRRRRVARRAQRCHSKTEAYLRGYARGYSAAYKRHWEYWRVRMRHLLARRAA